MSAVLEDLSLAAPANLQVQLNLNVRNLHTSATLAINERSAALQRAGQQVYRLGLGQSPFPVPTEVVDSLKANAHQKDYLPVRGLPALREAVAAYHARQEGVARGAEDVLIGPGSKELLFLLQLVFYGDLVIPAPSWVSYTPQATIIGRQVQWLQTSAERGWRLQPAELEALCRTDPTRPRLLILNYPNNPVGVGYDPEQLSELAAVARRYGVLVLSDEIYGELRFSGEHVSIARYYPEGTVISAGLSKWAGAGGWRLGTLCFPPQLRWLLDAMAVVASETFTTTSAPIQYAAVTAYQGSAAIDRYVADERRLLAPLGAEVARRLRVGGCSLPEPEGGFYAFPDLGRHRHALSARGVTTSAELCQRLLVETGVAVLPGSDFGRPPNELTLRLAYVDFDGAAALTALAEGQAVNVDFLERYCGRVLTAVDRIVAWLDNA